MAKSGMSLAGAEFPEPYKRHRFPGGDRFMQDEDLQSMKGQ
jgi:hypothetical protein